MIGDRGHGFVPLSFNSANKAAKAIKNGDPVVLDFSQDRELGELGMAGHAKQDLETGHVGDFATGNTPAPSHLQYKTKVPE